MKKLRALSFTSLLLFSSLSAEAEYQIMGDINFSAYSGGEDIITFQHTLVFAEDKFLIRSQHNSGLQKFGRLGEILLWDIGNAYLGVLQHEVFGHGYRIRDLGSEYAKVKGYSFAWDGAATHFTVTDNLTSSLTTTIASAGVEATAVLANRLRLKWLELGRIDGRESGLYSFCEQDITDYVLSIDKGDILPEEGGHDINAYLYNLQLTYPEGKLTKKQLRHRVLINYLDPFTWYSYFGQVKFVMKGEDMKIPMIPIGSYKYLPSLRLGLTPFGPEYYLENFLVKDQNPIYFYAKWGSYANNNYYGLGIEQPCVYSYRKWKFGYRFDAWRQPNIFFHHGQLAMNSSGTEIGIVPGTAPTNEQLHKKRLGMAASVLIERQIKESAFSGFLQPGFKTKGFLPGQALRAAPLIFGGLSIEF